MVSWPCSYLARPMKRSWKQSETSPVTIPTSGAPSRRWRSWQVAPPLRTCAASTTPSSSASAGDYGARLALAELDAVFNTHIGTWATHFFTDLEGASQSVFYAPVGAIGRAFMAIEIDAFRMTRLAQTG